jgi:hypothetical protein
VSFVMAVGAGEVDLAVGAGCWGSSGLGLGGWYEAT